MAEPYSRLNGVPLAEGPPHIGVRMCRWEGCLLSTEHFFPPFFKILKLNSNDTLMIQKLGSMV